MVMLKKFDAIKKCLVKCQIDNPLSGAVNWGGLVPSSPKIGELRLTIMISSDSLEEEIRFREVILVPVSLWEEA